MDMTAVQAFLGEINNLLFMGVMFFSIAVAIYNAVKNFASKANFTAIVQAVESLDSNELKTEITKFVDLQQKTLKSFDSEVQNIVREFKDPKPTKTP